MAGLQAYFPLGGMPEQSPIRQQRCPRRRRHRGIEMALPNTFILRCHSVRFSPLHAAAQGGTNAFNQLGFSDTFRKRFM